MKNKDIRSYDLNNESINSMVLPSDRIMGVSDLIWLWLGMTAQMGIFLLGASFTGRISYLQAMLAMIVEI